MNVEFTTLSIYDTESTADSVGCYQPRKRRYTRALLLPTITTMAIVTHSGTQISRKM